MSRRRRRQAGGRVGRRRRHEAGRLGAAERGGELEQRFDPRDRRPFIGVAEEGRDGGGYLGNRWRQRGDLLHIDAGCLVYLHVSPPSAGWSGSVRKQNE